MKSVDFKKMIKAAVKEAIQEELKDILFEAFRASNTTKPQSNSVAVVNESQIPATSTDLAEKRRLYEQALGETTLNFSSQDAQTFRPQPGYDAANGSLPGGSVGMDQIMNLMSKK